MADVEHTLYTDVHGATILGVDGIKSESSLVTIYTDKGALTMQHYQDCCEEVAVEDVCGDPDALVGARIVEFRESTQEDDATGYGDGQWTFYHIVTTREDLTIRWYGSSNGYYSIAVSCSFDPTNIPAQKFVKVDPLTFPEGSGLRPVDVDEPTSQAKEVVIIATRSVFRSKVDRVLSKYSACVGAGLQVVSAREVVEDLTTLLEEC